MKKIIKRTIVGSLLFAIISISGLVTLIFFPQVLFAEKFEYEQFEVYYDKNYDIEKDAFQTILDNAYQLIEKSELHNPNYTFKIFLAQNNIFNTIESLQGGDVIARATAGNIICKVEMDIKHNRVFTEDSKINLTELFVHEMVHILQADKYGFINFSPIKHPPMWKLEGYPEYVARNTLLSSKDYSLRSEIKRFISTSKENNQWILEAVEGHFLPSYYFKGRIMVEYLMDVQGMSYAEILEDKRTEEEVFTEMTTWVSKEFQGK